MLHYATRRRICRAGFVLLCLAPTGGVLAWSAWMHWPLHRAAAERELSLQTGLRARVARVSHPRPGFTFFHDLSLADAETGATLVRAARLEIGQTRDGTVVAATELNLDGRQFAAVAALLGRALRGSGTGETERLTFWAGRARLARPRGALDLEQVQISVDPDRDGSSATLRFQLAGAAQPVVVQLRRLRGPTAAQELRVDASASEIPCWLLVPLWPELARLGPEARYRGTLTARLQEGSSRAELQGEFAGVALASLLSEYAGERLSGAATLRFDRLALRQGRLHQAAGRLEARDGRVSPSLLAACQRHLHCGAAQELTRLDGPLAYRQLAVAFSLDENGLTLSGLCGQPHSGAMMVDPYTLLLAEPRSARQPVANLVRALCGESPAHLPATAEAQRLARVLPLDSASR